MHSQQFIRIFNKLKEQEEALDEIVIFLICSAKLRLSLIDLFQPTPAILKNQWLVSSSQEIDQI